MNTQKYTIKRSTYFLLKIMTYTIYNQGMNFIEKEKRPRH